MIVDSAIYVDGHRTAEPSSLQETYEAVRSRHGVAWIGLYRPTEEEFASVAGEFGLHRLAVEDATEAHQRPKFAPTLIGTIYGMNFRYMPELNWYFGYPFALALMAFISLTLYLVFKRRGWL